MARLKPKKQQPRSRWPWIIAGIVLLACAYVAFEYFRLPTTAEIAGIAKKNPAQSAMMQDRVSDAVDAGKPLKLQHIFVPLGRISMHLQRGVVLGEDAKFWMHDGVDWGETRKAVEAAFEQGKLGRGGSTITQQLAKNLYLSERRSVVRKLQEWVLADRLEEALTKKRILELYLNFAEWGEGLFGAEAAAQRYFHKSAAELDPGEASVLTAMLPAPLKRDPANPTVNLVRRSYRIADLLATSGTASRTSIRARVRQLVGPPTTERTKKAAAKTP